MCACCACPAHLSCLVHPSFDPVPYLIGYLQAHLKWREENGIDTILEDFHFQVRTFSPADLAGIHLPTRHCLRAAPRMDSVPMIAPGMYCTSLDSSAP